MQYSPISARMRFSRRLKSCCEYASAATSRSRRTLRSRLAHPSPTSRCPGHGEGSREALQQNKDRSSDFDNDRRVEVSIELVVTEDATGRVSLPTVQATSDIWSVTVNRLKLMRAGYAAGGIEIAIKNRMTGKEVLATARLDGPGWFRLWPFATEEDTGRKHVWFHTAGPVMIQDFEGTEIKVSKVDAKLLLGESFMYLSFPKLAPYSSAMMYHHFGVGMPNGFHVWGDLHLWGDTSDPVDREDDVQSALDRRSNESLLIIFPTGEHVIANSDAGRLDGFVTTWCRELLQRQPNQGPPG